MSKYPLGRLEEKLIGIITDGDLQALLKVDDISTIKTVDIMTQNHNNISQTKSRRSTKEMEKENPPQYQFYRRM